MRIRIVFFDLGNTLVNNARQWLPGAKMLLATLKQNGRRLGILSNTTGAPNRAAILNLLPPDFDLSVFEPDLVSFSSEVGVSKPTRAIFAQAVVRAHVTAEHCLFISEDALDTFAAQSAGLRALRIAADGSELTKVAAWLASYETIAAAP